MIKEIDTIIDKGISFLAKEQQPDGSFLSLSFSDKNNLKSAKTYKTTFFASLILSCCNNLTETPQIKIIKQKLVSFLLSQKSKYWSFNYWARDSEASKKFPYPDDLDDTCCALAALFGYNPKIINTRAIAKVVMLLTAVEEKEGGPYRTWLVPKDAKKEWQNVDVGVNSNIAHFLFLYDIPLPGLNTFLEDAVVENCFCSSYYPTGFAIPYFISRFYQGNCNNQIVDFLLSKCDSSGRWKNVLETALSCSSLLNIGFLREQLENNIYYIIESQQDNAWDTHAFSIDPAVKGEQYYAGSSALTTAFCLEAINKYQVLSIKNIKTEKQKNIKTEKDNDIYGEVIKVAKHRFLTLGDDLKKQATATLETTLKGDKDRQIVLLPYFFNLSLGEQGRGAPTEFIVQLGLANLYGWIAYTIYDDFLDEEGSPKLLSVANVCLRDLTKIFNSVLPQETGFSLFFQQVMDTIDSANTWEITHCRIKNQESGIRNKKEKFIIHNSLFIIPEFGDFSKLAQRSLGHALGPIAILFSLGYKEDSSEVKNLMDFFKYYLTARQLNDDAHDWLEDLKKGQINSVGSLVLEEVKKIKSKENSVSDFTSNEVHLQEIFWYNVSVEVCEMMIKYIKLAKQALKNIPIVVETALFERLLMLIKHSALQTIKEQKETVKFLKIYR